MSELLAYISERTSLQSLPKFAEFEFREEFASPECDQSVIRESAVRSHPVYVQFNSWWDEIIVTGIIPFTCLTFFNLKIYLKIRYVSWGSIER